MDITFNGNPRSVPATTSVQQLLDDACPDASRDSIAVAVNGQVVRRHSWSETPLAAGDEVEVVQVVGGG